MMIYNDYLESQIPIFPLWGIKKDSSCECDDPKCPAAGKHPRASSWQSTPLWSDEQVEFMEDTGQLDSGYGALIKDGLLVIDVDARNGGVESFERLACEFPQIIYAGLIVETGSGGGSRHFYFRMKESTALVQSLPDYPGIDFKSSGYVVGAGSMHVSGNVYKVIAGTPYDIDEAPSGLIHLLKKADKYRASIDGKVTDVSEEEIKGMLDAVDPDCGYEQWIRVGMAIHSATKGAGFPLWNVWSSKGEKYPGHSQLNRHWHSFGKSENPVRLGTLYHYAQKAGWSMPVTFELGDNDLGFTTPTPELESTDDVDVLRPPGFVGELVDYINSRCLYPREHLAVAGALTVMSSIAGMRYRDPHDGITPNVFMFGVAASATGKEAVLQATQDLMAAGGVAPAIHGGIKSEQEIFRNLIDHQAAIYVMDEMGEMLSKLTEARKGGGAPYLQGVLGQFMSIYSKADSFMPVTGDLQRSIIRDLHAYRNKLIDEHGKQPVDFTVRQDLERINRNLAAADMGIPEPYLNIFGLTTPHVFDGAMDYDMATNGFLGRCVIFRELANNPRAKRRSEYSPPKEVPESIANTLRGLYAPGHSDMPRVVARHGSIVHVETTDDAAGMLDDVLESFWQIAQKAEETTGLTPIPRRGYELVAKVSLLLAIPSGVRTVEHVRWAYKLIRRDIDGKLHLANANSATRQGDRLVSRLLASIDPERGGTLGVLKKECRKWEPDTVEKALAWLVKNGKIKEEEIRANAAPGGISKRYHLI